MACAVHTCDLHFKLPLPVDFMTRDPGDPVVRAFVGKMFKRLLYSDKNICTDGVSDGHDSLPRGKV